MIRGLGCPFHVVDPGFAGSRMAGLRKYEAGEVKEGVGAGGAMYAAAMLGVTQREMLGAVEAVYAALMGGDGGPERMTYKLLCNRRFKYTF